MNSELTGECVLAVTVAMAVLDSLICRLKSCLSCRPRWSHTVSNRTTPSSCFWKIGNNKQKLISAKTLSDIYRLRICTCEYTVPCVAAMPKDIQCRIFLKNYGLTQKWCLSVISHDPLGVCDSVFFCRDSTLCLVFLIFFLLFCVEDRGVVTHSTQVSSGSYKKVVTRCQTVSSRRLTDTTLENANVANGNATWE